MSSPYRDAPVNKAAEFWNITSDDVAAVRRRTEPALAELKREIQALHGRHLKEREEVLKNIKAKLTHLGHDLKADAGVMEDWQSNVQAFVDLEDTWGAAYESANEETLGEFQEASDELLEFLKETEDTIAEDENAEGDEDE